MVENPWKWQEGPQQITRLVQDGPLQLMVENPGKWREGPQWFLRTTNKTAPLGATKYWKRNYQSLQSSFIIIVSCPWFLLFCFVLYYQSWGSTYTRAFKNIVVFGLKNGGRLTHESTYTRENTVIREGVHRARVPLSLVIFEKFLRRTVKNVYLVHRGLFPPLSLPPPSPHHNRHLLPLPPSSKLQNLASPF